MDKRTRRDEEWLTLRGSAAALAIVLLTLLAFDLTAAPRQARLAAVLPARGEVTFPELKALVIEIRSQLRYHGNILAVQKNVRNTLKTVGADGALTISQVREVSTSLGADMVLIPVVAGSDRSGYEMMLLFYEKENSSERVVAVKAALPSRGAAVFKKKQYRPAAAAAIAFLLTKHPNPVEGPFPTILKVDPARILRGAPPKEPPRSQVSEGDKPEATGPKEEKKKKRNWEKWDHTGFFGEIGFMFSWCRQDGLCATTMKGYGARIRFGIRIMSYVALSITGVAVDHQMPITTNSEVFLNVDSAFVFGGVFGGIRVHPVRRFIVDPYVGIDFGNIWLLYAQNTEVETTQNIPDEYASAAESFGTKRRETIFLKGFTITPEVGANIFITPSFAFGFHAQWLIPFWRKACARVYNPTLEGLKNTEQICSSMDDLKTNEAMDDDIVSKLSNKNNLPKFVSIELDITLLFR